MIAKLYVKLSFNLVVPDGGQYTLRSYEQNGCVVQVGVPIRSETSAVPTSTSEVQLDGKLAFYADVLQVTFSRTSFARDKGSMPDPPWNFVNQVVNGFLAKLKFVTKASDIKPVDLPHSGYMLSYLHDDGSELAEEADKIRGRYTQELSFDWIVCSPAEWEMIHSLPPNFDPPEWRTLLTDASGSLPHVGTAVVLAATSLEVFISQVLSELQPGSGLPVSVWHWINNRENRQNNPTVEEQFSVLLNLLCGRSLKDESALWQEFKNLKTARNKFVHEGTALIGGEPVSVQQASKFIEAAERITAEIREWLPEENRWPVFISHHKIQFIAKLGASVPEAAGGDPISTKNGS